jgi:hypothetical protein
MGPAWEPLASASRDQTVRVFDIRSMKVWVVLCGHRLSNYSSCWPTYPSSNARARWRGGRCPEEVVVGDEVTLAVFISASGNCTMPTTLPRPVIPRAAAPAVPNPYSNAEA